MICFLCQFSYAKDSSLHLGFTTSLNRLNQYQFEKAPCSNKAQNNSCPKILSELIQDEDKNRALGLIQSSAQICKKNLYNEDKSSSVELLKNPMQLQKSLQSFSENKISSFSESVIRSCVNGADSKNAEVLSKFYYLNSRFSAASEKIVQENYYISQLLNQPSPECPNQDFFPDAHSKCQSLKKCSNKNDIKQVAVQAEKDFKVYNEVVQQIQKLPKKCEQDENCKKQKNNLSVIALGLVEMNPWFLNDDFKNSQEATIDKLKVYLKNAQSNLNKQQQALQNASLCLHGNQQKKCELDEIRETLSNTPELSLNYGKDKNQNMISKLYSAQSCVEDRTLDRNRTGKIMTDFYWDVGLTVGTLGLGSIANLSKLAYANKGSKIAQMMGLTAESANFSFDIYNAVTSVKEAVESCTDHSIQADLTQKKQSQMCLVSNSSLSPSTRTHGSCLVQSGFAGFGVLVAIPGGLRLKKLIQESGHLPSAKPQLTEASTSASSSVSSASSEVKLKRSEDTKVVKNELRTPLKSNVTEAKSQVTSVTKKQQDQIAANLPESIQLKNVEQADGSKKIIYEFAETLPNGKVVKTSSELPIDEVTGAINANFSTGRSFFDLIAEKKSGAAYFSFIDVGMLGAVNNKFKAGTAAGDRYLKAVADEIRRSGEGKITLARLGGDEFGVIIDSKDSAEVKRILEKIQNNLRTKLDQDAHLVFREEKLARAEDYRKAAQELKEASADGKLTDIQKQNLRKEMDELAQIQHPDISVGSAQIGVKDQIEDLQKLAEEQAKQMKIQTALNFGRSAEKYGSKETPRAKPNPRFTATIEEAISSSSWTAQKSNQKLSATRFEKLPSNQYTPVEEIKRFGSKTLIRAEDEAGRSHYIVENYIKDGNELKKVSKEIPINNSTGLLDGRHPVSQNLILDHIASSPETVLIMPKLEKLKYLNYFENGTVVGDQVLKAVADVIKKDMRASDLTFKLGGADFIWSLNKGAAENLEKISQKINADLANNPVIKEVLESEKSALKQQLAEVSKLSGKESSEKISELQKRLKQLETFKIDLNFQSASHKEIEKLKFNEIIDLFDAKFKKAREAEKP